MRQIGVERIHRRAGSARGGIMEGDEEERCGVRIEVLLEVRKYIYIYMHVNVHVS